MKQTGHGALQRFQWKLGGVAVVAVLAGGVTSHAHAAQPDSDQPSGMQKEQPPRPQGDGVLPAGVANTADTPVRTRNVSATERLSSFAAARESLTGVDRERFLVSLAVDFDYGNPRAAASSVTAARSAIETAIGVTGGREVARYTLVPSVAVEVNRDELEVLESLPQVRTIQPDGVSRLSLAESTTRIRSNLANASGYDGTGSVVAILDDGFDTDHPMLGNVIEEACASTDGSCDGGDTSTGPGSSDPGPAPCGGDGDHGTHVAGIAAGSGGVAPGASLMTVDVFDACGGGAYDSSILTGIDRVLARQIGSGTDVAAVNLSLGNGSSWNSSCDANYPSMADAFAMLRFHRVAPVVATGNDSYSDGVSYPACLSDAVPVGATSDTSDTIAAFSNAGPGVPLLLAPGVSIRSSVYGSGYATWDGTSMAAPHVAGTWAVLRQRVPTAQVSSIRSVLAQTGVAVFDNRVSQSFPRIDVYSAVMALSPELPPANDGFNWATEMSGLSGTLLSTNISATVEVDEPAGNSPNHVSHSVWFRWTAATSGTLYVNTIGSTYDTVLDLFQGTSIGALNFRTGNDDYGGTLQSRVAVSVTRGLTYQIRVDGYSSNVGNIRLSWLLRPSNDNFSNASTLSGGSGARTGITTTATAETGEPYHHGSLGRSVWWKYTAPTSGLLYLNTVGSNFDTVLAVYTGASVGSLVGVASNDDYGGARTSRVSVSVRAGQTYRIAVDGYGGQSGSVGLAWQFRPGNDLFQSAWTLSGRLGSTGSSSTGSSVQSGELSHGGHASHSVWWKYTAPRSGTLYLNTSRSRFDTVLAVYSGSSFGALSRNAFNDDYYANHTSRVAFRVTQGRTYYIAVDGSGPAKGTVVLSWSI